VFNHLKIEYVRNGWLGMVAGLSIKRSWVRIQVRHCYDAIWRPWTISLHRWKIIPLGILMTWSVVGCRHTNLVLGLKGKGITVSYGRGGD